MNPARQNFFEQAKWCDDLGSPFTALVCRVLGGKLGETTAFGSRLLNWPETIKPDAIALRACGALNFLARQGEENLRAVYPPMPSPESETLWRALKAAIAAHDEALTRFLDSAPQTNEVARSAVLLPAYGEIFRRAGLPLAIREIGASAGLNLLFDHYRYEYGAFTWGDENTPVAIQSEWRGQVPEIPPKIEVASRKACDLYPVNAADSAQCERMLAYIWPDQAARLARAEGALDIAARLGVSPQRAGAAEFAARELAELERGRATILSHTVFWQYIPDSAKASIRASIAEAAAKAKRETPFAWVRMEAEADYNKGAVLRLSLWPHGPVDALLAYASYHGQWVEWQGA